MCVCVSVYVYTYFNYATMILADVRLESNINMEGTIQRKSFLSNDDIELVETQRLTSETTAVGIPEQNHLQNSSSEHCTGMVTSSLYTLHNTNTHITLGNFWEEKFCWVKFLCWFQNCSKFFSSMSDFFSTVSPPDKPNPLISCSQIFQPIPSGLIFYVATYWYSHSRESGERCVQLSIGQYNQYPIGGN